MKKLLLLLAIVSFTFSCTPENLENENSTQQIDKTKVCPPTDKNCNGIPDIDE